MGNKGIKVGLGWLVIPLNTGRWAIKLSSCGKNCPCGLVNTAKCGLALVGEWVGCPPNDDWVDTSMLVWALLVWIVFVWVVLGAGSPSSACKKISPIISLSANSRSCASSKDASLKSRVNAEWVGNGLLSVDIGFMGGSFFLSSKSGFLSLKSDLTSKSVVGFGGFLITLLKLLGSWSMPWFASLSAYSLPSWPACPLTHCQSICRCSHSPSSRCHNSTFLTFFQCFFFHPASHSLMPLMT